MSDVFLSYKREDADTARRIVEALKESGLSVWWDDGITPRQSWDSQIELAISAAAVVLVLWSPRAVASEWVRREAHYAQDRGKLVPAFIERCTLPLAFSLTQTVNLSDWQGNREDLQWRKLLAWISDLIATKPGNANLPSGLAPSPVVNTHRDAVGQLKSGEPIYDGAFINPSTPPGTLFRDSEDMPVMRIVPRGSFLIGAPAHDPDGAPFERPQKRIDIPASYAIGVFPVLYSEYKKVCGTPPPPLAPAVQKQGWFKKEPPPAPPAAAVQPQEDIPLTNVSYDEAQIFADRISKLSTQSYRIPSEAEWEYACRAGTSTRYSCGDTIEPSAAAYGLTSGPVAVGGFAPNNFGLYDMHGNVREWTADLWHDSYDLTPSDGRPALDGYSSMRLVRGGGWRDSAVMLRSAARMRATQSIRVDVIGFRVARVVT